MDRQNKKLAMFDFDGVLVNTLEFSYKIHVDKNKNFTWKRFKSFSNGNFHEEFRKAVQEENFIPSPDFYDQYEIELRELTIHDVLRILIKELSQEYILAVISSTSGKVISSFLQKEGIHDCFADVLGHDVHISKVVKIQNILKKYEVLPTDAVLITDTLGDIREANECDVPSIAVTWGLHEREILEKGKPVAIIDDPRDLLQAIETVLK